MRNSAKKFALKVTAEKPWTFGPLAKARGDTPTRAEAMVFTRGLDYDIAIVADEAGDWGDYVPFRTVDPRPVGRHAGADRHHLAPDAGDLGRRPGAEPLPAPAGPADAAPRLPGLGGDPHRWARRRPQKKTADPAVLAAYLADPAFSLPAYKGVSLSYRPWDHQLRQPIIVVQPKAAGVGGARAGLHPPAHAPRHPRHRPAGDRLQVRRLTPLAPRREPGAPAATGIRPACSRALPVRRGCTIVTPNQSRTSHLSRAKQRWSRGGTP